MNASLARIVLAAGLWSGLAAGVWAQGASGTGSIYTCIDKQGRKLTSDRPITECIDREQRELGPSGTVRRVLGPTLTDHERAARQAQQRQEQEERTRLIEERRRDRVLIARYPDKAAHDAERAAAIALVDEVSNAAAVRLVALHQQRKALEGEMEFYRKDPAKAPLAWRRQWAENEEHEQEQQRFLAAQAQEKRRVHQRFDVELAQLRRLWAQYPAAPSPVPPAADATPAAAAQ